jgi:hypothetical protein
MGAISEHTECCRVSRGSQAANNHPLEQTLQAIQLTAPSVTVHSVRYQKSREIATIYVVDVGLGNMLEYARDCVEDCVDLFMLSSFSQRSGSPLIRVLAQTRQLSPKGRRKLPEEWIFVTNSHSSVLTFSVPVWSSIFTPPGQKCNFLGTVS